MWLSSQEYRKLYRISSQQLYQLVKRGKVNTRKISDRKYLYEADDELVKRHDKTIIYARVSTMKQKEELERQIRFLREYCVSNGYVVSEVYSDIGSGMNESRKQFSRMMEEVKEGQVGRIVISDRDRLTRFGFGYIESFCSMFGASIETVNLDSEKSFQEELTEDLITVIHYFSMRFCGKRKHRLNEMEKALKDAAGEDNIDIEPCPEETVINTI